MDTETRNRIPANTNGLPPHQPRAIIDLTSTDLPCPWCGQATHEADRTCRRCGRKFG